MKFLGYLAFVLGVVWAGMSWITYQPTGSLIEAIGAKIRNQNEIIPGLVIALVGVLIVSSREARQRRLLEKRVKELETQPPQSPPPNP